MTINDTGKYIFLELPDPFMVSSVITVINHLVRQGVTPIITHPERNNMIQHQVELAGDFIAAGALCQITAAALTGDRFGKSAFKCGRKLIKKRWGRLIASDAHSSKGRLPGLSRGAEKLSSIIGKTAAEEMMITIPRLILEGKNI